MVKRILKWTLLLLLVAFVGYTFWFLWKKSQPKPIVYETTQVTRGDMDQRTIVTGQVQPRDEVAVKPQINGIISQIYKQPGDRVQTGDLIAKIKVIPDMVALNSAESRVRIAEQDLMNSRTVFQRDSLLYKQRIVSEEDYDKSRLVYVKAQEELQSAQDNLSITRDGIVSKKVSGYSNTSVIATINGTLLDIPVKVGSSVILSNNYNEGTTVATIADLSDMLFEGTIDETEVGKLKEGMPMKLVIGALSDRSFPAVLEYIAPKGTETNGAMLFTIKGAVSIPDSVRIRAGYSANAEIVLDERKNVLLIDEAAVVMENGKTYVDVLIDSLTQSIERREIQTGLSDGLRMEVLSGVQEGEILRSNKK